MAVWSEVQLNEARDAERFDAEYWKPEFINNANRLSELKCARIADISKSVRSGPFGSNLLCEHYVPRGVAVIRPFNLKDFTVSRNQIAYIPEEMCAGSGLTYYQEGDVMIARVGDVRAGIIRRMDTKVTISPNVIAVRLKKTAISPYYLAAFLNSHPGMVQMLRGVKTVAQPTITTDLVRSILVPELAEHQVAKIEQKVKAAFNKADVAHVLYTEAEELLESVLGLNQLDLTPQLFYKQNYGDVQSAARLDAEYFQPPKKAVLNALSKMPGQRLLDQFRSIRQLWQPDRAGAYDLVRNYDLTDALQPFLDETVEPATRDTIASTKKKLRPGDLVVSRLRSYLKEIAVVLDSDLVPLVGSTEFIVLRPQKGAISVEALLVYLRSRYVQTVLKWCQDGSNHPRFHEDELMNLWIPEVVRDNQKAITEKAQSSIDARREARYLLDEAKAMVEQAILGEKGI